ncbi:helix-turn-helix domain-containing protein [Agarivorans sp. Toyoura001]|uniref:helix-turn-helix domain-containing protein n=1 Tax=Agarivorans sp. Toyoura001 TaxID=2283141 RepID=UPI0010F89C01|nr:helix-turn-helix domain-containing protein [Agarivorans sp. Toyoura001]
MAGNNEAALMKMVLEQLTKVRTSVAEMERRSKIADLTNKPILDINECGILLSMTSAQIYKLTSSREIPHSKIGKHLRFNREDIIEWVKNNRIATRREIERRASNHVTKRKAAT